MINFEKNRFQQTIFKCGINLEVSQSKMIFDYICKENKNGFTYQDFFDRVSVVDKKQDVWATDILSHIRLLLMKSKFQIEYIFMLLDSGIFLFSFLKQNE